MTTMEARVICDEPGQRIALYHNNHSGTFTDVAEGTLVLRSEGGPQAYIWRL